MIDYNLDDQSKGERTHVKDQEPLHSDLPQLNPKNENPKDRILESDEKNWID